MGNTIINLEELPLGTALAVKRIVKGIEQKDLAEQLGMYFTSLSKVEKGRQEMPEKYLEQAYKFLES